MISLKVDAVWEAAHVVMALDEGGLAAAGLDHVGIDCTLGQVVYLYQSFSPLPQRRG